MGRNMQTGTRCFLDDHADFFAGQRRPPPVGVHFDEVCAVADLFAYCAPRFFLAADHLRAMRKVWQVG